MLRFEQLRQIVIRSAFIKKWWWLLVIIGVILVHFSPMMAGRTLIFGDNYSLLVPGKVFTAYWLRHGQLPLWNPYLFSGITWIGDITQSVVYPSTLVFAVLPPAWALNVTIVGHVLFTAVGMYFLAKAWGRSTLAAVVASILWLLSTQVTGSINNLATIQSLSWLPWIIVVGQGVGRRRYAPLWLAVVVTGQFLAGYPQHVVYGLAMAGICSMYLHWQQLRWYQWVWAWVQAGLWCLAISAIAWVPFVPTLLHSTRMNQSLDQAAVGSLAPAMFAKAVLPFLFDKPSAGMKWGPTWSGQPNMVFYLGWLGWLVLGSWLYRVIRRGWQSRHQVAQLRSWLRNYTQEWWWFSFTLATILFALGDHLPGYRLLQQVMPFFRVGRYPSMILILTTIALILWLAKALDEWWRAGRSGPQASTQLTLKRVGIALTVLAGIAVVGLVAVQTQFAWLWPMLDGWLQHRLSTSPFHTLARDQVIAVVILTDVAVTASLAAAGVWAARRRVWAIAVLMLVLDLLYHSGGQFIWAPNKIYPSWQEIEQQHGQILGQPIDQQRRYLTRNGNQPYTDFGSYWEALIVRAPFSDSFVDSTELRQFAHPIRLRQGATPNWQMVYGIPVVHGYTSLLPSDYASEWSAASAAQVSSGTAETRINFIPYVPVPSATLAKWGVGYYLVDEWFSVSSEEGLAALPQLAKQGTGQLLELPATSRFRWPDGTPAAVTQLQQTPNSLHFTITADQTRSLVIADRFESGWRAWVDGQLTTLEPPQGMRQLTLEPGTHQVVLRYFPETWQLGLVVTAISSVCAAVLISSHKD